MTQKVIYEHECKDSAKHHLSKYKHWAKLINKVDVTKTNGFAFDGQFLDVQSEHKIDEGSLIVEVCGDDVSLFRLEKDGKVELAKTKRNKMSSLIEKAAEELKKTKPKEMGLLELMARKEELLKELDKINEQIKALQ